MALRISRLSKGLVLGAAGGMLALNAIGVLPDTAEAQEKSAIQIELEKLYEQDQREMPDMRLDALPKHTPDGRVFQDAGPQPQQVEQAPTSKKKSLLDRLPWFRKPAVSEAERPRLVTPAQPNANTAPARPANPNRAAQVFGTPQTQRPVSAAAPGAFIDDDDDDDDDEVPVARQPRLLNQPGPQAVAPLTPAPARQHPLMNLPTGTGEHLPTISPASRNAVPTQAYPVVPPSLPTASETAPAARVPSNTADLPSLDELPAEPLPLEQPAAAPPQAAPAPEDFFPDPFTDISESEADQSRREVPELKVEPSPMLEEPVAAPEPPAAVAPMLPLDEETTPAEAAPEPEANPFSGLKLEPPVGLVPNGTGDTPKPEGALPELDPAFEDEFELPTKKVEAAPPTPAALPKLERVPDGGLPNLPGAEEGDFSYEEEEARRHAKLRLIAERAGETGLKGFCIVTLRDERDLTDALPAFRSTYNLRSYHFSNLESKIEFDKDPLKYVPAYDGNDPILLSTQSEEREGSLDHALWFRGRLYLFTTVENKELFQRDPALFAAH